MLHQTALQQYKSTRIETGSGDRLIVMLYEGAIRFCGEAQRAMTDRDIAARTNGLRKASRIVQELSNALDHEVGGDLSAQLEALYDFVDHKLTLANLENQPSHVNDAVQILGVLLESWRKVADGEVEVEAEATAAPKPPRESTPTLSISV